MLELHNHRKLRACLGVGKERKKLRPSKSCEKLPRSLTTSKNVGFACLPDASPAAGARPATPTGRPPHSPPFSGPASR